MTVALVVACGLAATASAAKTVDSQLHVAKVFSVPSGTAIGFGTVTSPDKRCVDNRKVTMRIEHGDESEIFDVGRTGKNGGWQVRGQADSFAESTAIFVILAPKRVGKVKCGGMKLGLA